MNWPKASAVSSQTSTSIALPAELTRTKPGLAGVVLGSAYRRYSAAVLHERTSVGEFLVQGLTAQMGADHGQQQVARARRAGLWRGRQGRAGSTERAGHVALKRVADGGKVRVGVAFAKERDAERQAVGAQSEGTGERGQIEQIGEVHQRAEA